MIGPTLYWKLTNTPSIVSLLGTDGNNSGVYPNKAPEKAAFPHLVYHVISHPRVKSLGRYSGLAHPRVQIDAYGLNYSDVDVLQDAVSTALSDPPELPGLWNATYVQSCRQVDNGDGYIPPIHGDPLGVHRVIMEFIIWYRER